MAIALTASHMFIGAVSLGIAMFRGTEVNATFHHESTLAHASYGASKLGADHARSANIVVNNNTVMAAIMGPRFAVEADNITMDANAAIACPTCPASSICHICAQYKKNKPRALVKLVWVRAKQQLLWGTLGKLSGDIDALAFQQASGLVVADVSSVDAKVKISFRDPSDQGEIWGAGNADVACDLAMKDTLPSPMTGHAFPILISPNLLEELPKILVEAMPSIICKATAAATSAIADAASGKTKLGGIKEVAEQAKKDCRDIEDAMRCSVAAASGAAGSCGGDTALEMTDLSGKTSHLALPGKAQEFVKCGSATTSAPLDASAGGYSFRSGGAVVTCTFDRRKCEEKKLAEDSDLYLRDKVGLPKIVTNLAQMLGGSETRKPSSSGSSPKNFCACAYAERPVDATMIGISDAVRKIASFGAAEPSQALRKRREYGSCARWYFPSRSGEYAAVPSDEMPFVGAWKWNPTMRCEGLE